MKLFALCVINLFVAVFAKYNIFENQTIELKYGEIAYFETPNFPILHNATKFFEYNVTIATNGTSPNGTRCVFVFQGLSYKPTPFKDINDIYVFETTSFYLESYKYVLQFYDAFSGYVYFEEIDDNCVFESQSREVPYRLTEETESILIQSVYKNKTEFGGLLTFTPGRSRACKWQFAIPEGYGIKIVIVNFNISPYTKFRIHNTTDLLLNERSAQTNHAYYNSDNYTQIYLSADEHSFSSNLEFTAYVSIVKKNVEKIDGRCVETKENGSFIWSSNADLSLGYQNNVYCNYEVKVKSNTTFLGEVQQYSLENVADYLSYHDDQYSFVLSLHYQFVLHPYANGTEKNYYFQFITDGSVQASGFLIQFMENACHCGNSNIMCDNGTYSVMGNQNYVCPNLRCEFVIKPCESNYISLLISSSNYTNIDSIKVLSNADVVYDSNAVSLGSNGEQIVYLNSLNNNTLIVSSVSPARKNTTFSTKRFELPTVEQYVVLTENGFSFVLDASTTSFVVIEMEEHLVRQNVSLVIYGRNDLECKNSFYNNETLSEMVFFDNCVKSTIFYKCYNHNVKMAYFFDGIVSNCFLAFSLSTHQKNCLYPSTVYFVQGEKAYVSVMASVDGDCKATVIKDFGKYYVLSNLFTTAKDSNVEIWFGKNQQTKFLEYNKFTASRWKNITMMSEIYTIKVPKGAVALLTLIAVDLPTYQQISQASFYSLISTPHFGLQRCFGYGNTVFITFQITNVLARFSILEFKPNNETFFQLGNETIRINQTGDVFVFRNQIVSFHFRSIEQPYCGCYMIIDTLDIKTNNLFTNVKQIVSP